MALQSTTIDAPASLAYVPSERNEVIKVIALGLLAGLLVPALSSLIAQYFITPVFCTGGTDTFSICSSGGVVANHIAAVIAGFAAFAVLSHWAVYRALLLVVAATIAMWGLQKYATSLTTGYWLEYYLFSALLYALAYTIFYWLLRISNFVVSLIVTLVAVVAVCVTMVVW
jgi:hypothetical protein